MPGTVALHPIEIWLNSISPNTPISTTVKSRTRASLCDKEPSQKRVKSEDYKTVYNTRLRQRRNVLAETTSNGRLKAKDMNHGKQGGKRKAPTLPSTPSSGARATHTRDEDPELDNTPRPPSNRPTAPFIRLAQQSALGHRDSDSVETRSESSTTTSETSNRARSPTKRMGELARAEHPTVTSPFMGDVLKTRNGIIGQYQSLRRISAGIGVIELSLQVALV